MRSPIVPPQHQSSSRLYSRSKLSSTEHTCQSRDMEINAQVPTCCATISHSLSPSLNKILDQDYTIKSSSRKCVSKNCIKNFHQHGFVSPLCRFIRENTRWVTVCSENYQDVDKRAFVTSQKHGARLKLNALLPGRKLYLISGY